MTVTSLPRRINDQFQLNQERYVYASELVIKIEQLGKYFTGNNSLPSPTAEIITAWNDIPNAMTRTLPLSMKAKWPPAPPPTPIGFIFDKNEARFRINHRDGTPTPDFGASQIHRCLLTNDHPTPYCSEVDQLSDRQSSEEPSFPSTDSSDLESVLSNGRHLMEAGERQTEIKQWLVDYRGRGAEPFVQSLIAFGVQSTVTAQAAAQIAHGVVQKLSFKEGKLLRKTIRVTALTAVRNCPWPNDVQTIEETTGIPNIMVVSPCDLHLAGFIGSLFTFNVATVKDVHHSLKILMEGEKSLDRLCAIYELLVQADDKLCKRRHLKLILDFQHRIAATDEASGEYLWAPSEYSKAIVDDIITTIEQWQVVQAIKREKSERPSGKINARAVGPRLHNANSEIVVPLQEQ